MEHSKPADELCLRIHRTIQQLPVHHGPKGVQVTDGLYFFYENGEASLHAPQGRIVRVGNHSRSQHSLVRRLHMHYSGSKNSSVFRKFLGGAILRSRDSDDPCLLPAPGQGHWEKQGVPICPRCSLVETEVSRLLRADFRFRCLEVTDLQMRNLLEERLTATLSLCSVCCPSDAWLGKHAYSDNVRRSGLWNSNYVFDSSRLTSERDLQLLNELVEMTPR